MRIETNVNDGVSLINFNTYVYSKGIQSVENYLFVIRIENEKY